MCPVIFMLPKTKDKHTHTVAHKVAAAAALLSLYINEPEKDTDQWSHVKYSDSIHLLSKIFECNAMANVSNYEDQLIILKIHISVTFIDDQLWLMLPKYSKFQNYKYYRQVQHIPSSKITNITDNLVKSYY